MILIWRGWGILVAVIAPVCFLAALLLLEKYPYQLYALFGFLIPHGAIFLLLGGLLSAALTFALDQWLKRKYGAAAETRRDGLFFIRVRGWMWIFLAVVGVSLLYSIFDLFRILV